MTHHRTRRGLPLLASVFALSFLAGCYIEEDAVTDARAYTYVEPRPVTVSVAPPAPRVERRPAAPRAGLTWCGGYHDWQRGRWVWIEGQWCEPPQRGRVYDPPTVVAIPGGGYRYYPPSWRPADAPPPRRSPPVAIDPPTPSRPLPAPPPPAVATPEMPRPDPRPAPPVVVAPRPTRPTPASPAVATPEMPRPDPRPAPPVVVAPRPTRPPPAAPPVQVDVRPDPRPVTPEIGSPRPRRERPAPMAPMTPGGTVTAPAPTRPAPPAPTATPTPVAPRPDPRPTTPTIITPRPRPGQPAPMAPLTPGGTVTAPTPTRPGTITPGGTVTAPTPTRPGAPAPRPSMPGPSRPGTITTRPEVGATSPSRVPGATTLTCSVAGARAVTGGGAATITGTGFVRGAIVRVGGQVVPVTAWTTTSLTIQVPSRVGGGEVTVTNPGGGPSVSCGQLRMIGTVGPTVTP